MVWMSVLKFVAIVKSTHFKCQPSFLISYFTIELFVLPPTKVSNLKCHP